MLCFHRKLRLEANDNKLWMNIYYSAFSQKIKRFRFLSSILGGL